MSRDIFLKDAIPEELKEYINDKGVLEIIVRGKNQKYKEFLNVAFNNLSETESKKEVVNKLNQLIKLGQNNAAIGAKSLEQLGNIAKIGNLNLLLNGANLFATSAGFALIYAKLDKMSREIDQKMKELQKNIKDFQDVEATYKFNSVVSDHMDMLDCKRKNDPYSEDRLRKLIDEENNVLRMLLDVLEKDVSNDNRHLVLSIVSLASMLTASLKEFDEIYYFNNREAVGTEACWHMSHDKWMETYRNLSSESFTKILQDHALFELKLGTRETDVFYENVLDNIDMMERGVEDNMSIIKRVDDKDALNKLREYIDNGVIEEIKSTIEEAPIVQEDPVLKKACQVAVRAIG